MKKNIVLASQSPFRKSLMQRLGVDFVCASPTCNENELKSSFKGPLKELPLFLAKEKALSLSTEFQNSIIIGSDQILLCENKVFGKSKTTEKAFEQLNFFSGKKAELITSTYIYDSESKGDTKFTNTTELYFKTLSDESIKKYITVDQPLNCAGSFMFEKHGLFLFEKILTEDPTAIEGLPLIKLSQILNDKGIEFKFL